MKKRLIGVDYSKKGKDITATIAINKPKEINKLDDAIDFFNNLGTWQGNEFITPEQISMWLIELRDRRKAAETIYKGINAVG